MSAISTEIAGKITRLETVVLSTATVLQEIKTALDDAITAGSLADLQAVSARLTVVTDALSTAATTVDITPETPVEPPVVEPPPA